MRFDQRILFKALSPKLATKAIQTFDRATMIVVGSCWAAALLMMVFSIYTVIRVSHSRTEAEAALSVEPALPRMSRNPIEPRAAIVIIDRLKHRFPELIISVQNDQSIRLNSNDGSQFRQWLTALSYLETIAPEYNWSLQSLCVGKCSKGEIMNAALKAEKVTFSPPATDNN